MCAYEENNPCQADIGEPLVQNVNAKGPSKPKYFLRGIMSHGSWPCGLNKNPSVYTAVNPYRSWILENLK